MHLVDAIVPQLLRHDASGAVLFKAKFGMGVKIVPECGQIGSEGLDLGDNGHAVGP